MLPKFEYGHLYKFAVSLALLMIALGLALPWLVLRESGPLLIPEADLDALTPRARQILLDKQADHEWIADNYRYASIALVGAGLAVGIFGCVKWAKRQSVADEIEDTQRDTARAQLEQLTPAETNEKLDQESAEVVADEALPVDAEAPADRQTRIADVRQRLEHAEQQVLRLICAGFQRTHLIRTKVRLSRGEARVVAVDAVVLSDAPRETSYAIEIKFLSSNFPGSLVKRLRDALPQVALAAQAAGTNVPSRVAGVVILVMAGDPTAREHSIARRQLNDLQAVLAIPVGVVVISEAELKTADPSWLRRSIETAL